jgi:hypothetical protein
VLKLLPRKFRPASTRKTLTYKVLGTSSNGDTGMPLLDNRIQLGRISIRCRMNIRLFIPRKFHHLRVIPYPLVSISPFRTQTQPNWRLGLPCADSNLIDLQAHLAYELNTSKSGIGKPTLTLNRNIREGHSSVVLKKNGTD